MGTEGHVHFFGLVPFKGTFGSLLCHLSCVISVATGHV